MKLISYLGFALYKFQRILFLKRFNKLSYNNEKIMGAHGSFVIYSRDIFDKIGLPYDENMFLFAEECLLAHVLKSKGINTIMTKDIQVLHHEDGSMNEANIRQMEEQKKSITYYYDKLYKNK
jgi:GT2 family glycosyltransferase